MNDPTSPAPLVEQALQTLRDNAPGNAQAPGAAAVRTVAAPLPDHPTGPSQARGNPARGTEAKRDRRHAKRDPPRTKLDLAQTAIEADAASIVEPVRPGRGGSTSLDSAMEALRTVSVSAQTRLANPRDFPELPGERDVSDLGPYVEHVMRQAQAAAAAYREEAAREATSRATKLLANATALAEKIRLDADAYGNRTQAQADVLLAERVQRIAELTGRLSQMAQLAGDEFAGDRKMRDQMMQFISGLTTAAEQAVADVFPTAASGSPAPQADRARSRREVPS